MFVLPCAAPAEVYGLGTSSPRSSSATVAEDWASRKQLSIGSRVQLHAAAAAGDATTNVGVGAVRSLHVGWDRSVLAITAEGELYAWDDDDPGATLTKWAPPQSTGFTGHVHRAGVEVNGVVLVVSADGDIYRWRWRREHANQVAPGGSRQSRRASHETSDDGDDEESAAVAALVGKAADDKDETPGQDYWQIFWGDETLGLLKVVGGLARPRVMSLSCGRGHTGLIVQGLRGLSLPSALTFGCGIYGQLGHGDALDRAEPTPLQLPRAYKDDVVLAVECGGWHTVLLVQSQRRPGGDAEDAIFAALRNRVMSCGWAEAGQLGLGPGMTGRQITPAPVEALDGVGVVTGKHRHHARGLCMTM
jgi:alpha-tubulin suppressor-like RCC1 family protein